MPSTVERFKMETNFEGLIRLLAKHLYPEPDVFDRELIQNAHDSIVLRRHIDQDLLGRIEIECDPSRSAIVFRDNGLGMDRNDIKLFLSVIGSTGTGTARDRLQSLDREAAQSLVGQFGIGMLSAFVVAERVVVRTRKVGCAEAFAWSNGGSTECELRVDDLPSVGTEIHIHVAERHGYVATPENIREAVVRYADFCRFPILLNGAGPVNVMDAPWHRPAWPSDDEKDAGFQHFVQRRFPDVPLDVIPIEIDGEHTARGVLYISDRRVPDFNTAGVVDIYVRRMFVRAGDTELLPPWAKFIRGVIDSPDLQPTAARDNVQRDHPAFNAIRRRLGEIVLERLLWLAVERPDRFREINVWHRYHLTGIGLYHEEFFDAVSDLLLFETNRGLLPLRECANANPPGADGDTRSPIYCFSDAGAAPQFYRLANARDWVVVSAGGVFDLSLLSKYAERHASQTRLLQLDAADGTHLFEPPPPHERDRCRALALDVESRLRESGIEGISVDVRRFLPDSLPGIIQTTPESDAERTLGQLIRQPWFLESFADLADEALKGRRTQRIRLTLNAEHSLVRQLLELDTRTVDFTSVFVSLFGVALLHVPTLLTGSNVGLVHAHLVSLLDTVVHVRTSERFTVTGGDAPPAIH